MENSNHHYNRDRSRQTPDDVLSESQLLGRFFLDHEERITSLFSADAAEKSEQPADVDLFIRGAEWPKCCLLRRGFYCGERDRVVDVASGKVSGTDSCTADTMLGAAVRIAMRSDLVERAPLLSISPSPRVV